ncbi:MULTISPECIES: aminotransferase class V-fold PLP-dependent enzyme [unclassified Bradyrhizobium]|jgi:cysteine desulfurase / selenocysteine lyase|uniref:aminotransferase class V-fold PLP-dependent enzyme n=1 Tax=unclassified Bradyrhizobium TaxID=2631580 RepID=UPI001E34138C|nr:MULTISPECIES: aminotransferase class V-fold PLP-dependent enzyme [Bradyrhizobium]MCK1453093.1 aminotransferase class V-fold PLP-dependent enzyme [Bradyrhizobium sp. 35]MCK1470207.1 aminotransferase class V-fold PLP-dependent enzyme [Bradyrhizobium sp. CW10]MCK1485218.1 aminotransferase class V-fold PLP-dependent enzyme [Bradyrhizobium sp. 193]MCK1536372.1 aminotransferase class V-fold PLP-dependent enzyme [Bradyrhizobium sp. 176]MCK1553277.1 aminotransferase class V-fold PLP-dependent enzym
MMDIDRIRRDTPAASRLAYLHNAGAALMPAPVVAAMKEHIDLESEIGGYAAADREARRLESVYGSVARLLNAAPDEIALMENATVAWQMAFYALPFSKGDRILTAEAEYAANYVAFLQVANRTGVAIDVVPSDASGELDVDALERMIDERVKLIAITWVPTNGGLVNPAAAVGKIARAHGIPYLLDACQAVGQMVVDVEAIGCDMLSGTGRKFLRGPRGTGFLYVGRKMLQRLEPPMIDHFAAPWVSRDAFRLRDDARRFETWENNYAARLGLGAAVDYALDIGIGPIERRCRMLADRLRGGLASIRGIRVRDLGRAPGAIVSFTVEGYEAEAVVSDAAAAGITIGASDPSSTRIDAEIRSLPPVVRASPHYYNTDAEIDRLIVHLAGLTRR